MHHLILAGFMLRLLLTICKIVFYPPQLPFLFPTLPHYCKYNLRVLDVFLEVTVVSSYWLILSLAFLFKHRYKASLVYKTQEQRRWSKKKKVQCLMLYYLLGGSLKLNLYYYLCFVCVNIPDFTSFLSTRTYLLHKCEVRS